MYPPQPPYAPHTPPPHQKSRAAPLALFGCGTVLALFLALAMVIGTFGPDRSADGKAAKATVTVTVTQVQAATPQAKGAKAPSASASPTKTKVVKVKVPNVVGRNHQEAQDYLQSLGFYGLAEEDSTGQGRALLFDRNWVVVRQSPKAGTMADPDTATITLYSKKIGE